MWVEGRGPVPRTSRLRCVSGGAGLATRGRHVFDVVPNGGAGVSRSTQRGGVRGRKGGGRVLLMSWFKVRFRRLPGFVSWESDRPGCRLWHSSALSAVGLAVLRHVSVVLVCRERRQSGTPPASVIMASAELAALDLKKAPDSSSSFAVVLRCPPCGSRGSWFFFRHAFRLGGVRVVGSARAPLVWGLGPSACVTLVESPRRFRAGLIFAGAVRISPSADDVWCLHGPGGVDATHLSPQARLEAEVAKLAAKIEKKAQGRRAQPIPADVKSFAAKAFEEHGDYVVAAKATEDHFAKQHRKISLTPALLRGWLTPGRLRVAPDHFSTNSRGGCRKGVGHVCLSCEGVGRVCCFRPSRQVFFVARRGAGRFRGDKVPCVPSLTEAARAGRGDGGGEICEATFQSLLCRVCDVVARRPVDGLTPRGL